MADPASDTPNGEGARQGASVPGRCPRHAGGASPGSGERRSAEVGLESIVRAVPDIVYCLDAAGRIVFINDAVRQYGYEPGELLATSIFDLIHPEDRAKAAYRINERRTGDRSTRLLEVRLLARNRGPVSFELAASPWQEAPTLLVSAQGIYAAGRPSPENFLYTQGVARDITERKWASRALERAKQELSARVAESTAQLTRANAALRREVQARQRAQHDLQLAQLALDQAGEMVLWCDRSGRLVYGNAEACSVLGYRREQLLTLRLDQVEVGGPSPQAWQGVWETLRSQPHRAAAQTAYRTAGGHEVLVESVASFLDGQDRQYVCFLARPVTRLQRQEAGPRALDERTQGAHEMEAIGRLTAGVAHHFNNMLQGITGNLYLAQLEAPASIREFLEAAQAASDRAAQMIRQLMVVAGQGIATQCRSVDVGEVVREAVAGCPRTFDDRIGFHLHLPEEGLQVYADPGQLQQAVTSLLLNARDAIDEAGRSTGAIRVTAAAVQGGGLEAGPGWVRLQVEDDGVGMAPETARRIFEPFFTTKGVGRGTGLGLAIVYSIVREHGGWVDCCSEPGKGTSLSLFLPAAQSPDPAGAA